MAEVEGKKKKKLTKRDWIILGVLSTAFFGFAAFEALNALHTQRAKESESVAIKHASPGNVPPETVAKAISSKPPSPPAEQRPPAKQQNPPPPKVKPSEKKEPPKESGWKLPKPAGKLTPLPENRREERKRFTIGLPKPTLFKMREEKKERIAEKMRVITPRLVVTAPKSSPARAPQPEKQTGKETGGKYTTVVAAGMFVPAVLSQGIMAPLGYKVPVRFKVVGSAVGVGSYSFPLNSCVVLGVGKGIQTGDSARIEVELVKLSCVWPDGKLHTVPVTGYTVDLRDGKLHLAARLEEHMPDIVQKSFVAGALLGAAEAAQRAQEISKTTAINQNTSITTQEIKNPTAYTFWGGVAGALSQTQRLIEQKVQELMKLKTADREPGGKVYLVFTQNVRVPESWLRSSAKTEYDFAGYER
ncbi:hypothetical protein Theam_1786 (plasmid) [Thermovibrio ammonificans HB-1]|uniref:Conjugation TrbI family protein n=1 Tax=Thermovibrio ammonificans (strain DSM 15698 / JCM 12110 / HB-1) TaxID=648996 RepID=E8T6R9_THEA1|nr:TrbI/VirB10 family protein [Thermovibrio ammonificans]ADU97742.1 hypothetical protein Theam_1786 [Thermovibrio ammonificans HB-1]